jgi:hypothetical protein
MHSPPALAAPDFQITVAPTSQTLPPGQSVAFRVGVGGIEGFAQPVSLSVEGLPQGVTAGFSVNTVNPSGSTVLTLTASEAVATGTFSVTVIGTGGGITHEATGEVRVDFGLVPVCFGAAEGVVTDRETGLPVADVQILGSAGGPLLATTNVLGHYRIEQVDLGPNNSAREFSLVTRKDAYFDADESAIAVCDQTNEIDFSVARVRPAAVSGRVVVGTPDPSDPSVVIPTSTPLEGAKAGIISVAGFDPPTGPDGSFGFEVRLGDSDHPNQPTDYDIYAFVDVPLREGYWDNSVPMHLEPGENTVPDIPLVKVCAGSVSGTVVYEDTGLPASGVNVHSSNFLDGGDVPTDSQGEFSFPTLTLGRNNAPTTYGISAQPEGYEFASANAPLTTCGAHQEVELVLRRSAPRRFAAVEGHVYDEETGAPVADVQVSLPFTCPCDTTDANGHYRLTDIQVREDGTGETTIRADHPDYWRSDSDLIDLRADETSTADLRILRKRYAGVTGVVRDAITDEVIENAAVGVDSIGDLTDAAGRYSLAGIELGNRNAPRDVEVRASADGYWPKGVMTGLRADETTTQDFELLPICRGATITGTVLNAATGEPIERASITGGGAEAFTDASGEYRLENVAVGVENEPLQVDLTASAAGFFSQTKRITVFCGANIVVDFGRTPPATGAVEGFVTNANTGAPIADVFVGSEFGGATRTNEQGYYKLIEVPLNPDGSSRTWDVTADPEAFDPQTKPVTVRANETARLDFAFGVTAPGRIVVKQQTEPSADPQEFSFTTNHGPGFALEDGESNDSGPLTPAGDYSVSQVLPVGWDLASATCSDGSPIDGIDVGAGETVTCTFTNVKRASAVIEKQTSPDRASGNFSFIGVAPGSIGDGGQLTASNLLPGTYSAQEADPAPAFDLESISCNDDNSSVELASRTATLRLEPGETVKCVFTNKKRSVLPPNKPPTCNAIADPDLLWPPNHKFRLISLSRVTDPDGDPVTVSITTVTQDEPLNGLGDGDTAPDAKFGSTATEVYVRAERSGLFDGRVYRINYRATDSKGASCTGIAAAGVPHDQGQGRRPIDSGPPIYNSFGP